MDAAAAGASNDWSYLDEDEARVARYHLLLPALLSVIAGMVDLTGFVTLGNIFTAHITGNLVVLCAVFLQEHALNWAQALAIPVFALAVAAVWGVARWSRARGTHLLRLLLRIQLLLLAAVLLFCAKYAPSADPHGSMATIAIMIAVCAMGCQYALLRLAMPNAPSTAVMTGNMANTVLSLLDASSGSEPLTRGAPDRLKGTLVLLVGFLGGCLAAAAGIFWLGPTWTWALPVALAAVAVALARPIPASSQAYHADHQHR